MICQGEGTPPLFPFVSAIVTLAARTPGWCSLTPPIGLVGKEVEDSERAVVGCTA